MTTAFSVNEVTGQIEEKFPGSILKTNPDFLLVENDSLPAIAAFLKDTKGLDFNYLNYVTAVDYFSYFEIVYQLTSLQHNHSLVLKTRCYDRDNPVIPSIVNLWQGADFQEREIYDLMGIKFEGHPNMKRIFLWEGYQGHPLRKDYLE